MVGAAPQFDVVPDWEHLPAQFSHRDVTAVDVDSHDNVYLLTRSDNQVLVYDRAGKFIRAWGQDIFTTTHGLTVGPDDRVYCVDAGDHSVRVFTPEGELLRVLGTPGEPSDTGYEARKPVEVHLVENVRYPGGPFNRCTNLSVAPNGDLFVADGYANCRVHRFTPDGKLLASWGEVGRGPGQFHLPHGILVMPDGRVLVADRENDRIQVFDMDGRYLDEWNDIQRPCDLAVGKDGLIYVAELWRPKGKKSFTLGEAFEDHPGRLTVLDDTGGVVDRWGASSEHRADPGNFIAPHGVTVDSRGDVYVAEVTYSFAIRPGWVPPEDGGHQLQKFIRRGVS